jgi:hypothetical protein
MKSKVTCALGNSQRDVYDSYALLLQVRVVRVIRADQSHIKFLNAFGPMIGCPCSVICHYTHHAGNCKFSTVVRFG